MAAIDLSLFSNFLSETEHLIENIDILPGETAVELYDMYGELGKAANLYIKEIDPEIRVIICDRLDEILERVIDVLPENSVDAISDKPGNVFSPALCGTVETDDPLWVNAHILKDCGLSVYLLAKEFGARPTMLFGTKPEDYPNLALLPDMEMMYADMKNVSDNKKRLSEEKPHLAEEHIFDAAMFSEYRKHLLNNYSQMDLLIFYAISLYTAEYLDMYRKVRPDGKVYCALDANSEWLRRKNWKEIGNIGTQCDVIATSCRTMRDEINRNQETNILCRWFTNGFYNPTNYRPVVDADYKENTILTVGRLGTGQKNNAELLKAFAIASEFVKGWKLKLVGPIQPEFNEYINYLFNAYPQLKKNTVFTGPIYDRAKLYDEYARAKIFTLTSILESGTPNVYAEALAHGCKFITSDIDAADDVTNFGQLGVKYKLGDVEALASEIVKMCNSTDKAELERHFPKARAYFDRYYDWNRNIKKLRYMMYGH